MNLPLNNNPKCKVKVVAYGITKLSFYWSGTITCYSICVRSDIVLWVSGRLPEVKNNRKIQITSIESGRGRLPKRLWL